MNLEYKEQGRGLWDIRCTGEGKELRGWQTHLGDEIHFYIDFPTGETLELTADISRVGKAKEAVEAFAAKIA